MRREFLKLHLAVVAGALAPNAVPATIAIDPRLHGRWKSDRAQTLQVLPRSWTAERVQALGLLLGKFEWQFSTDTFLVIEGNPGEGAQTATYPMRIVATDDKSVVLEIEVLGQKQLQQLFFEKDHLYGLNGNYLEYFKRVEA